MIVQPPVWRPRNREVLRFTGLKRLADFFTTGPGSAGQDTYRIWGYDLANITFVGINYHDGPGTSGYSQTYAYEALEALYTNRPRLSLRYLQLRVHNYGVLVTIDTWGIWTLLKFHGLHKVILQGDVWDEEVSEALRHRLRWGAPGPPIPGRNTSLLAWATVQSRSAEAIFAWLEKRHRFLEDRETITRRRDQRRRQRPVPEG